MTKEDAIRQMLNGKTVQIKEGFEIERFYSDGQFYAKDKEGTRPFNINDISCTVEYVIKEDQNTIPGTLDNEEAKNMPYMPDFMKIN